MENNLKIDEFIKKVNESKDNQLDLSSDEDLSIAIMNLVSIEEHFFFTGSKTGNPEYFDLLQEARKMRGELLKKLVKNVEPGSEQWCISKHLLATTMRLFEVGTKNYSAGKKDAAKEMFDWAYKIYSLFWALRLKLIDTSELKKIESGEKPWAVEDLVNKLVDCCDE